MHRFRPAARKAIARWLTMADFICRHLASGVLWGAIQ
jgi:hypothetical protein